MLLDLSRAVTSSLDLQEVLDASLAALRQLVDFGGGSIQLVRDGALMAMALDPPGPPEAYEVRIPLGSGVSGTIAKTGEPCYIPDITLDDRVFPGGPPAAITTGVRTYFGLPLILHGEPIGVVQVDSLEVDALSAEDRELVMAFMPTIAAAVQNAELFAHEQATLLRLRELQRARDDFLSVISHELRTPLTIIVGLAETLGALVDRLDPVEVASCAERILHSGRHLQSMIEEVLELAALGSDPAAGPPARVVVADLLAHLTRETEETYPERPVVVAIEPQAGVVLTDGPRLLQLLHILVGNACKYSPPGSPVEIAACVHPGGVRLTVTDHGAGIEPGALELVFEPFYQAQPATTRTSGGLGLGLSIVRHVCTLIGATVDVESTVGQGTSFHIIVAGFG